LRGDAVADVKRVVRQWLATDAAFGVSEVPLPRRRGGKAAAKVTAPVNRAGPEARTQVQRAVETMRQPTGPVQPRAMPVPPRTIPPAAPRNPPERARPDEMAKKKAIEMPPAARTPEGIIAELQPLSRQDKIEQLEQLRLRAQAQAAEFICEICTRLVFGEGDPDAPLMFVGEGPGAEEDKTGRPFVGRSGQLLDKMIVAMGFKREQLYIANVVKLRCADPDELAGGRLKDRPPTPEEAARGLPILHQQIAIIRPKVIVTLGAPAVKHLTGTTEGVTKIRGTWLAYRGIPVMPTYHPSFLLRAYTQENRRKVWGDLQLAMGKVKGP